VPAALVKPLDVPPVVGAGLLALDRSGAGGAAELRLRRTLTPERLPTEPEE
jgi:hypothetical protein